jgi:hypothetical protein
MPSLLIAAVTVDGEVSVNFTGKILGFQMLLTRTSNVQASFDFFDTTNAAMDKFYKTKEFDMLVLCDARMAIDPAFFLDLDPKKPFTVASYPLTCIDWDRVKEKITLPNLKEAIESTGHIYNVDPSDGRTEGRYVVVKKAGLGIFKIAREVLDTIARNHGTSVIDKDGNTVFHAAGVADGVAMSADERFCHMWGGPIYADTQYATQNSGTVAFSGCVGARQQLR